MNKKLLLSAFIGVSLTANAQSTLTSSINPHPNDNHTYYSCAYQSAGASGANVTWDFSSVTSSGSSLVQYGDCNGNPSCSSFPGSSLIGTQTSGGQTVNMFQIANNSQQSINGIIAGGTTIKYTDPEDILRFPFTYNTTYTDNFKASFTSGMIFYRGGSVTVTGDAYGTLKTPSGVFSNVIRVHRVETYRDSTNTGGTPMLINYVNDMYTWYSPYIPEMLLSISNLSVNGSTNQQGLLYSDVVPTGVAGISNLDATLDIYPNPAQGQVNVKFRLNMAEDLHISVVDVMGKEVGTIADGKFQSGDQNFTYNTSNLPAGMYIVRIQSAENTVVRKIQVQ